ncbi:DUF4241 domain-containing protein [Nocardia sp. CDC160]|uniref:DUF4241 domain-containing protein n=1 Tax=Nocardia sp. CDC160 TaxID=3112166 RepID=UPI002DBC0567|nr:DUF4241 domain-containing protein [Nocardia sp. CDC160]MEC3919286.1 DUF4241 domain-containing protein [Nocardia sp. CDC160]
MKNISGLIVDPSAWHEIVERSGWVVQSQVDADRLGLVYCEGWADGKAVGPFSAQRARERDVSGEPYAVMIADSDGRILAYVEIAWAARFACSWHIDERHRRWQRIEYRKLDDGRLSLFDVKSWAYATPESPEFDNSSTWRRWQFFGDGNVKLEYSHAGGDSGGRGPSRVDPERFTCEWVFGDWARLCGLDTRADFYDLPIPESRSAAMVSRPWSPPEPLQPEMLEELFTSGTRMELDTGDRVTVEVSVTGALLLGNSGVVIDDPGSLCFHNDPLRVNVAPGEYTVELARVRFDNKPTHTRVAAAKLVVVDEPPVTWEMARRSREDPIFLGDGEFFGFGVDSGAAAFVDGDMIDAVVEAVHEYYQNDDYGTELAANGAVIFESGWGDGTYPVWVGHDRNGVLCAVVADFCIAHRASVLHGND